MKRQIEKSLGFYLRHGPNLTVKFLRKHGLQSTLKRIRIILFPPKSQRILINLSPPEALQGRSPTSTTKIFGGALKVEVGMAQLLVILRI
jgi:hypothetical protein